MSYTVTVSCVDKSGLVADVTTVLKTQNLNIIENHEHVEVSDAGAQFFMRTRIEGDVDVDILRKDLTKVLPHESLIKIKSVKPKKIVVLGTKEFHCLGDILLQSVYGDLQASVSKVIANHDTLSPLVESFSIPFVNISHEGRDRKAHEDLVLKQILEEDPDYVVLAKYMRILSPDFVAALEHKLINIHHSFLPAFIGAKPYHQAYERGVKIIGATAHFVTSELDQGPIISQNIKPVTHAYSAADMARAGRDVERLTLTNALKLVFDDRVIIHKNKTIVFE